MTDKNSLRTCYKKKRLELTPAELLQANGRIFEQFQKIDFSECNLIHLYTPIAKWNEPDTVLLRDFLYAIGKRCATGIVVENTTEMQQVEIFPDTQFRKNNWDIPEPVAAKIIAVSEIDLVVVPLLCCDKEGNRVGYGKGFYDVFLRQCKPNVQAIGLSFFEPLQQVISAEAHDVKLSGLLSPNQFYRF